MKTFISAASRPTGALCIFMGLAGAASLSAQDSETADPNAYRNWLELSVGGSIIDGNTAQFQQRSGMKKGVFGGIEDLHWEQDVGKRGLFEVDARALVDQEDYLLRLELSEPDVGYVNAGFRQFRTYHDGSGGYFPTNDLWFDLYDDELGLNRGEIWFEAGLRRPETPELTLRYSYVYRNGTKDSTVNGDSNLTGTTTRSIVPAFYDLDERRHTVGLDGSHTFGNTKVGLGFRYEKTDNDDARKIRRRPTETADRYVTQREQLDGDMFHGHAFTDTRVRDDLRFTMGYGYTSFETGLSGSRTYGSDYDAVYDPLFARRQQRDEGFLNLEGGSKLNQHVANMNLMWTPVASLAIVPGLRFEKQDLSSATDFLETNVGAGPTFTSTQEEIAAQSERGLLEFAGNLEVRYTGVTNVQFYARAFVMHGDGDTREVETLMDTGVSDLLRDTDFTRWAQKYTGGANWYPLNNLNFAVQYYYKLRDEDYTHTQDTTGNRSGNRYPAFIRSHSFKTDDANARVTWRVLPNLTSVSRYDLQLSSISMQGDGLAEVESAQLTSHIFSQSFSWSPLARLYLQCSASLVLEQTDTPADEALGANQAVLDSEQNYWNGTFSAGYALTESTDIQGQYFYYRADNYVNNAAFGQPYGVGAEEHGVNVTLQHRFSPRLTGRLRYGFYRSQNETEGGRNDYDAHMIYSSMTYLF